MPVQFTENTRGGGTVNFSSSRATVSTPGLREATEAEARAMTAFGVYVSPLGVSQAIDELGLVTGTSGHVLGFLDGANTWSGVQSFTNTKLSAFAATTSAELAGVISNETGSGSLVFGTSPTLTTSLLMGSGFVMDWASSDVLLTHSTNKLTITGGTLSIGTTGDASLLYLLADVGGDNLGGIKVAAGFTGTITHNAGIFVENVVKAGAVCGELFGISINGLDIASGGSATYISLRVADPTVISGAGTLTSGKAIVVEGGICEFRGGIAGGLAVGSDLTLRTTTGTGDGTDYIIFQRGTNGATEMARMGLGGGSAKSGLSINSTTITDNAVRFGSSTSTGSGLFVDTGAAGVAGTGLTFTAGASGSGTNLAGSNITFLAGPGTGNSTTAGSTQFYGYFPVASGTGSQTLTEFAEFSYTATARDTLMKIYDVDNATLERVTVGVADSGGAGFKLLRIPN